MKIAGESVSLDTAIQFAIAYGPGAYRALVALFSKENITQEDLLALIDESASKNYDSYIAAARAKVGG